MTFLAVCAVLFGVAGSAQAQTGDHAEAVGERRALGFYRALRSGETDSAVTYFRDNFAATLWERRSEDEWGRLAMRLIADLGQMELEGVDIPQPHTLTLTLAPQDDAGPVANLGFEFEAQPPHRIAGLSVELGAPAGGRARRVPALELREGATEVAVREALRRYVTDLADHDRFSGTVLVARDGEIVFTAAHGLASKRYAVPNRLDTRFDIGSINKAFTKIAIGQLLEQGKLSVTDRMIDHLPDYPNREAARKITIAHLLEHRSGLGDLFTEKFFRSSRALYRSPSDYFSLFAEEPLLFEPGTGRQYSNAGYIVLGAIVEGISGEPYVEYIQRHVFEPAKMSRSGFFPRDGLEPDIAEGYTRMVRSGRTDEMRSNMYRLPIVGNPAGSAQSTVEDLWRFDAALREHKLLSAAYTAWFFGGDLLAGGAHEVADTARAESEMGIAGGGPGVSAVLESDGRLVVVVLSNYDPPTAEAMGVEMFRSIRQTLPTPGR